MIIDKAKLLTFLESEMQGNKRAYVAAMKWVYYNVAKGKFDEPIVDIKIPPFDPTNVQKTLDIPYELVLCECAPNESGHCKICMTK